MSVPPIRQIKAPELVRGTPLADEPAGIPGALVVVDPTQVRRPWRSTARTVFQALTGIAPMAPVIYQAATDSDPALATGAAGLGLAIAGGVARVMALPGVESWLRRFIPFLAAAPKLD